MESPQAVIIGVHEQDRHSEPPRHLFADVVLLDSAGSSIHQLKDDILPAASQSGQQQGLFYLPKGSFVLMGDVLAIDGKLMVDKKKKIIRLTNGDTISYKHLIIASGSRAQNDQWSIGVKALIDALKLQKKVPTTLPIPCHLYYQQTNKLPNCTFLELSEASLQTFLPKHIEKIAHHHLPQNEAANNQIIEIEKHFFEVQV